MNIIVHGNGTMGNIVAKMIEETPELNLVAIVDELKGETGDVIIDFSHHSRLNSLLDYGKEKNIPILIATTGYSEDIHKKIEDTSKYIPILLSSNTSLGINVLNNILNEIVPLLHKNFDIEIVEKHHNKKLDSPSGTAKTLLNTVIEKCNDSMYPKYGREGNCKRDPHEIGVHSLRGGTIVGEHSIIFAGEDEILEIKHTALSKKIFAKGAIEGAISLCKKAPGLYEMKDIF